MTSEWIKLTSQDGEDIHVNLANASTIEVHKERIKDMVSCRRQRRHR
jgi:hypothetical protein